METFPELMETFPDHRKFVQIIWNTKVCLKAFFSWKNKFILCGKFPKFLEIFQKQFLQSIWNINVGLKAIFHEIIRSYCLDSFPEFLETFPEQIKHFKGIFKKKIYYYYNFFIANIFGVLFGKLSERRKTFQVAMLPCYRGFSLSAWASVIKC